MKIDGHDAKFTPSGPPPKRAIPPAFCKGGFSGAIPMDAPFCLPEGAKVTHTATLTSGDQTYVGEGDTPQAACDALNAQLPEGCPRIHYNGE